MKKRLKKKLGKICSPVATCDAKLFLDIVLAHNEQMHRPRLVEKPVTFEIEKLGKEFEGQVYEINTQHPMFLLNRIVEKKLREAYGDGSDFAQSFSYSYRINILFSFIAVNRKKLLQEGLIKIIEDGEAISHLLIQCAAIAPLTSNRFNYHQMINIAEQIHPREKSVV